jgi:uncharacterized protein involved in exopolysaccharide biosynthesis
MIDDIYITGDDLRRIYQTKKKKIWRFAVFGALLTLVYFLFSPPSYQATATFKQSSSRSESAGDLKKLVRTFSGGGSDVATVPLMLSRAVLSKTVEELGLQASVNEQGRLAKKLSNCRNNLFAEIGRQIEEEENFQFKHVSYAGEKPRSFFLRFSSSQNFELLDKNHDTLAVGRVEEPLYTNNLKNREFDKKGPQNFCSERATIAERQGANENKNYEANPTQSKTDSSSCLCIQSQEVLFTLAKTSSNLKIGKLYPLSISPLYSVVGDVKKRTVIKPLREDKNILVINFSDANRQRSALFVNTLISKYEEFLIEENKTVIGSQLKYLDQRQNELNSKLDVDIQDHVAILKQSLLKQGFMGIEEEIDSILLPLQTYQSRLNEIEIEMAGLLQRISQTDSALATKASPPKLVKQFGQSLAQQINDTSLLLNKLEKDEPLTPNLISSAIGSMVTEVEISRSKQQTDYAEKKHRLASHLHTFLDHLALRQKNLQESSNYIDQLESDFSGMTLEASRGLFQQYCRQLDELHAQLKQVIFFRDHLNEPNFEISTLSNILNDSVTQQLVQKSSEISGQLCDLINRSGREHERLKETLSIQKRFLESHLSQTLDLGKIRIQLIKEKISSLYGVMQDLLQKEKSVLENKIEELKGTMQELPELWHLDKRLKFKAELTKAMMEGLTHIAESKNLSRHLYQVESKPLDLALTPFSPQSPRLLMKCFVGAFVLAALFYFYFLIHSLIKGLPASLSTLRLMGGHTSGIFSSNTHLSLNKLPDQDLETLRAMASFLLERKNDQSVIGLLSKRGSHFCFNLAHLLSLHHQKILIIDCNFDRIVAPQDQPGLWQYLNHTAGDLPIRHEKHYDLLTSGGTTRHGVELLASPIFSKVLAECKSRYDFIFLLRQTSLSSQDAAQILQLSNLAIITADEEAQDVLKPYLQWSRQKEISCATFAQHLILPE